MNVKWHAYLITARKDLPSNEASVFTIFQNGFTEQTLAGSGTTIIATSIGATPYMNQRFCSYFKILKHRTGILTPVKKTISLQVSQKIPQRLLRCHYVSPAGATNIFGRAGVYKAWMVTFCGEDVNDNTGSGITFPFFTTAPYVINATVYESLQWALTNSALTYSTGMAAPVSALTQHIDIYNNQSVGFVHNWNTFPVA